MKSVGLSLSKGTIAQEAYDMITNILHTDNRFDGLPISDRKKQRQTTLLPKVGAYFAWVKNKYNQVTHNSTIGRKNFILMETDNGARASAMLYSIVETTKANSINTYQYLELLLTELPKHAKDKNLSFLDNLMPWSPRVLKECPSKFKNLDFSRCN